MVSTDLYIARCKELGLKQPTIAKEVGIERGSLHRKVHNKENLTPTQILKLMDILDLDNPCPILLARDVK